jgi:hypothetical protein
MPPADGRTCCSVHRRATFRQLPCFVGRCLATPVAERFCCGSSEVPDAQQSPAYERTSPLGDIEAVPRGADKHRGHPA